MDEIKARIAGVQSLQKSEQRDWSGIEWEYDEEVEPEDFTDEQMKAMTSQERMKLLATSFNFSEQYLTPKMLLASDNILPSQLNALQSDPDAEARNQLAQLAECMNKGEKWQAMCFLRMNCGVQLKNFTTCRIKHQKSKFLCKVPKLEYLQCQNVHLQQLEMAMASGSPALGIDPKLNMLNMI